MRERKTEFSFGHAEDELQHWIPQKIEIHLLWEIKVWKRNLDLGVIYKQVWVQAMGMDEEDVCLKKNLLRTEIRLFQQLWNKIGGDKLFTKEKWSRVVEEENQDREVLKKIQEEEHFKRRKWSVLSNAIEGSSWMTNKRTQDFIIRSVMKRRGWKLEEPIEMEKDWEDRVFV